MLVSFGLNDARAGTPVGQFIEDLRHIVMDIKSKTEAVVVMVNAYFMTDFDRSAAPVLLSACSIP